MKAIGWIVSYLTVYVSSILLNGWTLSKLWYWFVVPTLHAPVLNLVPAIGISLVVRYLTWQIHRDDADDKKSQGEWFALMMIYGWAAPLFAFATGWIIHLFL